MTSQAWTIGRVWLGLYISYMISQMMCFKPHSGWKNFRPSFRNSDVACQNLLYSLYYAVGSEIYRDEGQGFFGMLPHVLQGASWEWPSRVHWNSSCSLSYSSNWFPLILKTVATLKPGSRPAREWYTRCHSCSVAITPWLINKLAGESPSFKSFEWAGFVGVRGNLANTVLPLYWGKKSHTIS
jgi:hypothetical protein